jgi:hypothetical protein
VGVKAQPELSSFVDFSAVADTVKDDGLLVYQDFKDDSGKNLLESCRGLSGLQWNK